PLTLQIHTHPSSVGPIELTLVGDFFFVLICICCNFNTINGFLVIKHTRSLLSTVYVISSEYSFWIRSRDSDVKIAPLTSSCWSFRRWTLAEYADGTHRYFLLRSNDSTLLVMGL
ncbi:hypothetical protein TorRG33x02_028800, partial [Trema orientale]